MAKTPNGDIVTHRLLSENPERYVNAAVHGIKDIMGTTVATNALLERKGEDVLLLITKVFGDLLKIGYQNLPKLFDLEIKRPALLYKTVFEIPERLDADGAVVTVIDLSRPVWRCNPHMILACGRS